NGETSISVGVTFADADPLRAADRDFVEERRDQVINGPVLALLKRSPQAGSTTNIASADGAPLVLKSGQSLPSSITSLPHGYSGLTQASAAELIANSGRYNTELFDSTQTGGGLSSLLGGNQELSLTSTLRHRITSTLEAFLELSSH